MKQRQIFEVSFIFGDYSVVPHAVSIKLQLGLVNHSQCIKLIGQCTLPNHKLGCIGPVQTVHTICP